MTDKTRPSSFFCRSSSIDFNESSHNDGEFFFPLAKGIERSARRRARVSVGDKSGIKIAFLRKSSIHNVS